MEEGYGQHYESMYTGSMIGSGALVFALMGYIISKTRPRKHTVDLNPVLLATIFGEPVDAVERAIDKLCQPDPKSRSKAEEGRRLLRRGEFEYFVVNHEYYRRISSKIGRRWYMAELMAKKRAESASMLTTDNHCSQAANSVASASASVLIEEGGMGGGHRPSLKEVLVWAEMRGLAPWKAEDWFNEMQGCGWLDYAKRPIHDWQAVLTRVKTKWESDGRPTSPPKNRQNSNTNERPKLKPEHTWGS